MYIISDFQFFILVSAIVLIFIAIIKGIVKIKTHPTNPFTLAITTILTAFLILVPRAPLNIIIIKILNKYTPLNIPIEGNNYESLIYLLVFSTVVMGLTFIYLKFSSNKGRNSISNQEQHSTFGDISVRDSYNAETINVTQGDKNHIIPNILVDESTYIDPLKFTGRQKELSKITKIFESNSAAILIQGSGGIGKSTLSSYYFHKHKDNYDYYAYIETGDNLEDSLFISLSESLNAQEVDSLNQIMTRLRQLKGSKLLVIDNLNFNKENYNNLNLLLNLQSYNFDILITSRDKFSNINNHILIEGLTKIDAKRLFNKIVNEKIKKEDNPDLEKTLEYIDYHPLFINIVAKTISPVNKIQDILHKFNSGQFTIIKTLDNNSYAKFLKEKFSFDVLDKKNIIVLQKLAILPSINIPYEHLEELFKPKDKELFIQSLTVLVNSGWIQKNNSMYKMHQIIKEFILEFHLVNFYCIRQNMFTSLFNLVYKYNSNFKFNNTNSITKFKPYIIYIINMSNYLDKEEQISFENLKYYFRYFLLYWVEAKIEDTIYINRELGLLYRNIGLYDKALYYTTKANKKYRAVRVTENNLFTLNSLAILYKKLANYDKAIDTYLELQKIIPEIGYKITDIRAGQYFTNMANVYVEIEDYNKSDYFYTKALRLLEKNIKANCQQLIYTYDSIIHYKKLIGDKEEVEIFFKKLQSISSTYLKVNDPQLLHIENIRANFYYYNEEYDKAYLVYKGVLKNIEENDLSDTFYKLRILLNIASVYYQKEDYNKSEKILLDILQKYKDEYGDNHIYTSNLYIKLASNYNKRKEYIEAYTYYKKSIDIREKFYGVKHPQTAIAYNNIAIHYRDKEDFNNAFKYIEKSMKIKIEIFNEEHTSVAKSYKNLASIYKKLKEYNKAKENYEIALDILEKKLLNEHNEIRKIKDELNNIIYLTKPSSE